MLRGHHRPPSTKRSSVFDRKIGILQEKHDKNIENSKVHEFFEDIAEYENDEGIARRPVNIDPCKNFRTISQNSVINSRAGEREEESSGDGHYYYDNKPKPLLEKKTKSDYKAYRKLQRLNRQEKYWKNQKKRAEQLVRQKEMKTQKWIDRIMHHELKQAKKAGKEFEYSPERVPYWRKLMKQIDRKTQKTALDAGKEEAQAKALLERAKEKDSKLREKLKRWVV